jgi:hypothetical protein
MKPDNFKDIDQELEALAPSLKKLAKPDFSDVPDAYFEQLPAEIWKNIQESESNNAKPKESPLRFFTPQFLAIAASLVILLATIFTIKTTLSPSEEDLTSEELLVFMLDNNEELDEELFYSFIEEEDLIDFSLSSEEELDYFIELNINEFDDSVLEEIF